MQSSTLRACTIGTGTKRALDLIVVVFLDWVLVASASVAVISDQATGNSTFIDACLSSLLGAQRDMAVLLHERSIQFSFDGASLPPHCHTNLHS